MASNQEGTVSLKIFIDKKKRRVVLAESDKHFVDILLSFLVLPMGTIVRVLGKESTDPAQIGSLNNLYESVEKLNDDGMLTQGCDNMLLRPHNIWESRLKNLKVNVDNSEAVKLFTCSEFRCNKRDDALLSYNVNAKCWCGRLMTNEVKFKLRRLDQSNVGSGEVFITGAQKFLITDDLQIMCGGPTTCMKILSNAGIKDMKQLVERTLTVGLKTITSILKQSFFSRSPLTDVFLANQRFNSSSASHALDDSSLLRRWAKTRQDGGNISFKLLKRKSDNTVLYAETREDFVDFLLSFLLIPLGTVVSLFGGINEMGCLENLYNSVSVINSEWFVNSKPNLCASLEFSGCSNNLLRSLIIFSTRSCSNQLLNHSLDPHIYYYCRHLRRQKWDTTSDDIYFSSFSDSGFTPKIGTIYTLTDPKVRSGGYVQAPTIYIISDDLNVTPVASYTLSSLNSLEFSTNEFEECSVDVGPLEALHLLKAALTSTRVFTNALFDMPKMAKIERDF